MRRSDRVESAAALCVIVAAACALAAPSANAEPLDWARVADVDVIEVVTRDEDGDPRETKVWFVRVDGQTYLRTSGTSWLANLQRDPQLIVRIDGEEYPQRAEPDTSAEMVARVDQASREKYGFQDRFIRFFRTSTPDILRLSAPETAPATE